MFARIILSSVFLTVCLSANFVCAAPLAGVITAIQGTALVSTKEGMVAGYNGQVLEPGTRVVVTARSRATIVYDDGCQVPIGENSRAIVRPDVPCGQLKTEVIKFAQASGPPPGVGPGPGVPPATPPLPPPQALIILGGTAARLGYEVVEAIRHRNAISPH